MAFNSGDHMTSKIYPIVYLWGLLLSPLVLAQEKTSWLILADRVFDGSVLHTKQAVLIKAGTIQALGPQTQFTDANIPRLDLGDATLLPGLIELHAHINYRKVATQTVLRHGITTARDLGGPVFAPKGGDGRLRQLTSGPLLTAPGGYPIPTMGSENLAIPIGSAVEAQQVVQALAKQGATVIKVALEPGGEVGAPWAQSHHDRPAEDDHAGKTHAATKPTWPILSLETLTVIVNEAHSQQLEVIAHIGDARGAALALDAGVDQWAHVPCSVLPDELLAKAARQNVKIITTSDTLDRCAGVVPNMLTLAGFGADFYYGSEIAHGDVPWGINSQELTNLVSYARMSPLQALNAATAKAGQLLGIPMLGTLQAGAPADLIAVPGNPLHRLKLLENPDLVVSGGAVVVNLFNTNRALKSVHPRCDGV